MSVTGITRTAVGGREGRPQGRVPHPETAADGIGSVAPAAEVPALLDGEDRPHSYAPGKPRGSKRLLPLGRILNITA